MQKLRNVYRVGDQVIDLDQIVVVGDVNKCDMQGCTAFFPILTRDDTTNPIKLCPNYEDYNRKERELFKEFESKYGGIPDKYTREDLESWWASPEFKQYKSLKKVVDHNWILDTEKLRDEFMEAWTTCA